MSGTMDRFTFRLETGEPVARIVSHTHHIQRAAELESLEGADHRVGEMY